MAGFENFLRNSGTAVHNWNFKHLAKEVFVCQSTGNSNNCYSKKNNRNLIQYEYDGYFLFLHFENLEHIPVKNTFKNKLLTSKGQITYLFGFHKNFFLFLWVGHSLCTADMSLTTQCVPMRYSWQELILIYFGSGCLSFNIISSVFPKLSVKLNWFLSCLKIQTELSFETSLFH